MIVRQPDMGVFLHYLICGHGSALRASDVKFHALIFTMKNQFDLPPFFEVYQLEQKRKKKTKKTILIVIAVIIVLWTIAIMALVDNEKDNKVDQAVVSKPTDTTKNLDSISLSTQTQNNDEVEISKEEQDSKARDAVAILDVYVKHNMNDPDSFEEISYDYSYHKTYFIILLKFRGKNAFGGKVINYIKAKTDLEGNVIEVLETNN